MMIRNAETTNVLMVFPRFNPNSFWSLAPVCEIWGARCPAPPLGLITLAAMLPQGWNIRLINRNSEELAVADLDWADLVMTGGMLPQQDDTLVLIDLVHARGKPVVVGGPDATSSPDVYRGADFLVLGEAEAVIEDFIKAWSAGVERGGVRGAEVYGRRHHNADPAFRSPQIRALSVRRRAVLARLPVQLRVLRHHRALWPRSARQDQRSRCWPSSTRFTPPAIAAMSTSSTTT